MLFKSIDFIRTGLSYPEDLKSGASRQTKETDVGGGKTHIGVITRENEVKKDAGKIRRQIKSKKDNRNRGNKAGGR